MTKMLPVPNIDNKKGFAPDHDPGEIFEIAKRLMKNM